MEITMSRASGSVLGQIGMVGFWGQREARPIWERFRAKGVGRQDVVSWFLADGLLFPFSRERKISFVVCICVCYSSAIYP